MPIHRKQLIVSNPALQLHQFDPERTWCDGCNRHAAFEWRYAVITRSDLRIIERGTWIECLHDDCAVTELHRET